MNFIKQAWYSLVSKDDSVYPKGKATVGGKTSNFTRLSVYGVDSNPPVNSHILLFNSRGQESNQFGLVNDFENRKKDLKEGEVAVHNTKTGAFVYFKEDGSVAVEGAKVSIGNGTKELLDMFDQLLTLLQGSVDNPGTASTGTNSLILGDLATLQTDLGEIKV